MIAVSSPSRATSATRPSALPLVGSASTAAPSAPVVAVGVVPAAIIDSDTPSRGSPVRRSVAHACSVVASVSASRPSVVACTHVIAGRFCQYSSEVGGTAGTGSTSTIT